MELEDICEEAILQIKTALMEELQDIKTKKKNTKSKLKREIVALKESLIKETEVDLCAQFLTTKTAQSFSISHKSPTIRNSKPSSLRSAQRGIS